MVGREVSSFYKKDHDPQARVGPPVLAAVDIADGQRVKGCSLTVHAGEVVGLAGLIGAGRTELAHLMIGASPKTSGHVELEGRAVTIRTPGEALDAGIAYLTEDRKALGLFLDMSCLDNINLACWAGTPSSAASLTGTRPATAPTTPSRRWASAPRMSASRPADSLAATSRRCCCRACLQPRPRS